MKRLNCITNPLDGVTVSVLNVFCFVENFKNVSVYIVFYYTPSFWSGLCCIFFSVYLPVLLNNALIYDK